MYSNLGNEHFDAGFFKCSRGPRVPHPCPRWYLSWAAIVVIHFYNKTVG